MATAAMAVGIVYFVFLRGERRPEKLDAAAEQQVSQAYDRMIAAAESLKLDDLFAELMETNKGALIANGRLFLTRDAVIERTRANFRGITALKYTVRERHVTMLSPTAALLVATGTNEAQISDGRKISAEFAHTVVLVLEHGRWRVLHSHQSAPVAH
jgi:uncharacterized protein (TIGR02246 family)